MSVFHRRFLPDRLRPRAPRRRSRRSPALPAAVVALAVLVTVSAWRIESVEVSGAGVVPPSVVDAYQGLAGHLVLALDLDWARRLAASWPAAGEVEVRLDLPGTLVVEIHPEVASGSVLLGRGWHAVAADGGFAGPLDGPVDPRLEGFHRAADRRLAFAVARRLAEGSGGEVEELRQVTPADYRVSLRLGPDGRRTVVDVDPGGTAAEQEWFRMMATDGAVVAWADLRWPYRLVLRRVG